MDFFAQQDRARASTKRLVTLFVVAVVLTNLTVYLALAGFLRFTFLLTQHSAGAGWGWVARLARRLMADGFWSWELLGWVTLLVTTVVGLVSAWKLRQLSRGGAVVAQWLGGRLVSLQPDDAEERRLLNLVEEMAIASGLPVPDVYVLDEESGINAFAAGNDPAAAVIGVTFGALKLLNRDELQGVIAHEFSHILNGDMRLNTRLLGWSHGLLGLVVLGRILSLGFLGEPKNARGASVGPVFNPVFLPASVLGWICIMAGSFGAFSARLVKSAVCRQREYLADAAAVQFTRNPAGLACALKKIGGLGRRSGMAAGRAEEASHMYFSDGMGRRWFGFLETHPPLTRRIRQLDPYFDGKYPVVSLERVLRESRVTELYREQGGRPVDFEKLASVVGPAAAGREFLYATAARQTGIRPAAIPAPVFPAPGAMPTLHLDLATRILGDIPATIQAATREPFRAVALLYGMICSKEPEVRTRLVAELAERTEPGLVTELERLLPLLDNLDPATFLPLADLAARALRQLSPEQYETFRGNLEWLVEADRQIDLFEYMLQRLVVRHLEPHFRPVKPTPVQYYILKPLQPACAILLSALARIGAEQEAAAQRAYLQGAALLPADEALRFLPLAECNLPQMDAALAEIAQASRPLKQQIFAALTAAAATDGQLQRREAELLRAVADALGLSVPPFLGAPPVIVSANRA